MSPAARVGDATSHGGAVVGPGEPTVLIGGVPAARVGDQATCPLPGHAPVSPLLAGAPTVLIGGMPAVRLGDPTACGATVALGEPTVLIG